MKKILLFIIPIMLTQGVQAQTFSEWSKQKKTQLKYLSQQIVILHIYSVALKDGYGGAMKGLRMIGNLKNHELNLHEMFNNKLMHVRPVVQRYARVAEVIILQKSIMTQYKNTYAEAQLSNAFTSDELKHIYIVFMNVLQDCINLNNQLISVTTDKKLRLSDDERLKQTNKLYYDILNSKAFIQKFSNEIKMMKEWRENEKNETSELKSFYDFK